MKLYFQLIKNMGFRYIFYRVKHELEKRLGVLKHRFPSPSQRKYFISLEAWKDNPKKFFFKERESLVFEKKPSKNIKDCANKILNGEIQCFSYHWLTIPKSYEWVTNLETKYKYNINKHWSEIEDFSEKAGDIKYLWEKSRFTYFHAILRYDFHFEVDHSEWIFNEIDDWISCNPINKGPNWRCSQEISLRLFNWSFALNFYKNSKHLTEKRWKSYQNVIYWQLHHVYHHINFSRIAVRNNHAITETGLLALSEILFSYIPQTTKWSKKGRKWFEQEIAYQIYKDGTFLQFSMNYHRVVIQLLTLVLRLSELNNKKFSKTVYSRAFKSLNFLLQCQATSGHLPNYGANDGALFFQWSDTDFRDYRPQLEALHRVLTGKQLYKNTTDLISEDCFWWGWNKKIDKSPLNQKEGLSVFEIGGYYTIRDKDTITFMRCGNHKDRPSQADNLHLDIWKGKENILWDGGSYKYNTEEMLQKYFFGTQSHNTVIVNEQDQMLKGSRFIWYYWSQAKSVETFEFEDKFVIKGSASVFRYLDKSFIHERTITKFKDVDRWEVEDKLFTKFKQLKSKQIWHAKIDNSIEIQSYIDNKLVPKMNIKGYYSPKYGLLEEKKYLGFEFNKTIKTVILLKAFKKD